jgi:1,2-diacylglycerol 3-alpha-glucosyltransferase
MNILMLTNTFDPIVGGLEKSVKSFTNEYRKKGHRVVIVAPVYENQPEKEEDVIRIPAIQHFNGTDFSIQLPIPGILSDALSTFKPDIVHSHHPFLVGDAAIRISAQYKIPHVFTHHTLFEQYTHYVPVDSPAIKTFVIELSTGYANLATQIFAPSESVAQLLKERGVETPIDVVPTGVYLDAFSRGDGKRARAKFKIPENAYVVGHVGRLAPEKNLIFLSKAIAAFLKQDPTAHFLIVGQGPSEDEIRALFKEKGVHERLHMAGILRGEDLTDSYHAMDVFAFASQSETQGMVVTEAMAASVPVVAVDAPGVREVVKDKKNGRLLASENLEDFVKALRWFDSLDAKGKEQLNAEALKTAESFSMDRCAEKALGIYEYLNAKGYVHRESEDSVWDKAMRRLKAEWELVKNLTKATTAALTKTEAELEETGTEK